RILADGTLLSGPFVSLPEYVYESDEGVYVGTVEVTVPRSALTAEGIVFDSAEDGYREHSSDRGDKRSTVRRGGLGKK
ncbi:hypothetical protein, partial [Salmonella enterica]|uniref:hypothetical protein n=1 Tax=Salmonella enterica TaxID=28901 RepID=UPI001B2FF096